MTDTHNTNSHNTSASAPKRTPLYQSHLDSDGKLVDFSGWELPIHYGSQIEEHEAVRTDAGMFDVSHMVVVDVKGSDAKAWLQKLLANDVDKLKTVGKALYSPMLNEQGGIIDDLIVYLMNEDATEYRIVSNAATRDKDMAQFNKVAEDFEVALTERDDLAMLAIQGPNAVAKLAQVKPSWADTLAALKPFVGADLTDIEGKDWFVARTGYTGEDGV
ncbi:MAG: glycine cleavage system aminomethyltransferase GcvT, partial [Psychrobacter sp.]|nr:glycine cleavage system aminomethyltransferase GcvT [Psychrobacter sp.]